METNNLSNILTDNAILNFYGWWQLVVCAFAFVALLAIWYHIGRKQKDFGQVFLALSILCWSASGIAEIIFSQRNEALIQGLMNGQPAMLEQIEYNKFLLGGWRSIFSLFNSLFILLSLPWFRYIPDKLQHIVKSNYWPVIVALPFVFSLLPTVRKMSMSWDQSAIAEFDVYYAILTLVFLGYVLFTSFYKRRLKLLSWLSLLCILVILAAQLFKFTDSEIQLTLFSAIFKSSLIMLIFALALSWVKELSENIIPDSAQIKLKLSAPKVVDGRSQYYCEISGIPSKEQNPIKLTPSSYQLLRKFAEKRKLGEGWLEIKPKSDIRSQKEYDIKDYNEVKRMLSQLLDGIFGKENWTKDKHEQPLKHALLENNPDQSRQMRLRLRAEQVILGE